MNSLILLFALFLAFQNGFSSQKKFCCESDTSSEAEKIESIPLSPKNEKIIYDESTSKNIDEIDKIKVLKETEGYSSAENLVKTAMISQRLSFSEPHEINVDKIYNGNPGDQVVGRLQKLFTSQCLERCQTWDERYSPVKNLAKYEKYFSSVQDRDYKLFDIGSEIANVRNSKKIGEKMKKMLEDALLNEACKFFCGTKKCKIPYGKAFAFQDVDDDQWYGLITTGNAKLWKLLTPDGKQISGNAWIETSGRENEIVFRHDKDHDKLDAEDWIIIVPKTQKVIKEIRSFKLYEYMKNLNKDPNFKDHFRQAAFFNNADTAGWEFVGFFVIETNETKYDEKSTMYKIKYKDAEEYELKDASDLTGKIEVGDTVVYQENLGRKFGVVMDVIKHFGDRVASGDSSSDKYKVMPVEEENDPDEEEQDQNFGLNEEDPRMYNPTLTEKDIYCLRKKAKPFISIAGVKQDEKFSKNFFEQIAGLLHSNVHRIQQDVKDHVTAKSEIFQEVHPKEYLSQPEIDEVIGWAKKNKVDPEAFKKKILDFWKNKMSEQNRGADNLSVTAAQKIWEDKIEINGLSSKNYDPQAQVSISLRQNDENELKRKRIDEKEK